MLSALTFCHVPLFWSNDIQERTRLKLKIHFATILSVFGLHAIVGILAQKQYQYKKVSRMKPVKVILGLKLHDFT